MLDPSVIAQRAMQRDYPRNWRVYRGIGGFDSTRVAILWTLAAISIGFCIWLDVIDSSAIWEPGSPYPRPDSVLALLFWGVPGVCIIGVLAVRRKVASKKRSILVLHPDGVVVTYGGNLSDLSSLSFPQIRALEFAQKIAGYYVSSYTYAWLDVYSLDGTYRKWSVKDHFGDSEVIYKSILAAYTHYRLHQTP